MTVMIREYSQDEAFEASVEYFNGDELAAKVFLDKYALRDNDNRLLERTPEDMHYRLAGEFARIEYKKFKNPLSRDEIFQLFDKFKYIIPQGSPMSGIGNYYKYQSIGNCFVLPSVVDSYGGILYTDQQLVQLAKRRAGVGFDISNIRPKGVQTKNAAKTTDGISVFMKRFSNSCREVAQNGRRGALLLSISVHHPEILTFINIKRDLTNVTGANISIKITDEFMDAVKNNKEYQLRWPVNSKSPKIVQNISAKEVWESFINASWESAEPGVLFEDTIKEFSTSDMYKTIDHRFEDVSSNPCGEIVMGMDSCRLISNNLYSFVVNPFKEDAYFDFELYEEIVKKTQRLADDMIDLEIESINRIIKKIEEDPEEENIKKIEKDMWIGYKETAIAGRRTGVGITGLADVMASLGIQYGSDESIALTEKIYKTLAIGTMKSSCEMAKELGSFPIYNKKIEKDSAFLNRLFEASEEVKEMHSKYGRRNISLTTTAPTGSVSAMTQTSSGIEPVFMIEYMRRKKVNPDDINVKVDFIDNIGDRYQHYTVYHHNYKEWMNITGKKNVEDSPYYKATSENIDWKKSVDIQSVAQKWITHSISKTCNLPSDASKELISEVYMRAYDTKCKGFTVYRDGCRSGILVSKESEKNSSIQKTIAPKRPESLQCYIHHATIKGIRYYAVVGMMGEDPYEVFTGMNHDNDGEIIIAKSICEGTVKKLKRGHYVLVDKDTQKEFILTNGHSDPNADALTRIISTALRHGADTNFVTHQLEKTKGDLQSFAKVLARVLKKYIKDGVAVSGETCPTCGNEKMRRIEGCISCDQCGYSKCG